MRARNGAQLAATYAIGLMLAFAVPAQATIYKCLLDNGQVFYQDSPCAPGRELRDFDKDPANVSVLPFTTPASPPASGGPRKSSRARSEKESRPRPERATAKHKPPAQAGHPSERKFLRPGMSEAEVLARVGPPDMTSSRNRKGQRWTYMPMPEDAHTITNLQFDHGRLVEVERKVIR